MEAAIGSCEALDATIRAKVRDNKRAEGFRLLYDTYAHRLHRLCLSYFLDPMLAEDALQESLVTIWKKLHQYGGRAPLLNWLAKITRHCCLARLKQHDRLVLMDDDKRGVLDGDSREGWDDSYSEQDALRIDVANVVSRVPELYRGVLILFYYEDRSVEDIAQLRGVPVGTVKTQLFRAREMVDRKLRELGVDSLEDWLEEDE